MYRPTLVATLTLYTRCITRLGALSSGMAGLFTIAAGERVDTRLSAVTSTMADLIADEALDLDTVDGFGTLLLARLRDVAEFAATVALGDHAVHDHPSVLEALHVLFRRRGPTFGKLAALGFSRGVVANHILAVDLALEVDDGHRVGNFLFLYGSWVSQCPLETADRRLTRAIK